MAELYYDFHIHSCLSPCGDEDMTPANIVGMAAIKGLDVIAVTDHNSCKNCPAVLAAAEEYGILALPGMEINTSEEIHAVCLFSTLAAAMAFDGLVYEKLQYVENRPEIFGKQQIYNEQDEVCGEVPGLLINAVDISFEYLWDLVMRFDGVMFPAHIDKQANGLLGVLGCIPPNSSFGTVELKNLETFHQLKKQHPMLEHYQIISNSDAHDLGDIREPELTITVKERSRKGVIEALRGETRICKSK